VIYDILAPKLIREMMSEGFTEITATWKGEMAFVANNTFGGTVQMGSLNGNPGLSPMQLLLAAIAGCTGEDILSILKKKRVEMSEMQIRVRGKRADDYPKIWTQIHIVYLIWSRNIKPKDIEQAIQLSTNKYCSVGIMLEKSAKITYEYQILKPGEIT
jgi:putative redox protein